VPALRELLSQALDLAHAAGDGEGRWARVEAVAALAVELGEPGLAAEVALDLPDASARGWLHASVAALAPPGGAEGRAHLTAAEAALEAPGARWRAREGGAAWTSPEVARATLVALYARHGAVERAWAGAERLGPGRIGTARAWVAVAAASSAAPDTARADAAWSAAREAARAVDDAGERGRLLVGLVEAAVRAGEPVRAAALARELTGDAALDALTRARLAEAVAGPLAAAGFMEAAAWAWGQVLDLVIDGGVPAEPAVDLVARVARTQEPLLGAAVAASTAARAVEIAQRTALPPEPAHGFGWRTLAALSLDRPALALPLREHLRHQPLLPPAWCALLAELERRTGHPSRARRAAELLEQSHHRAGDDPEALACAAVVRAALGDLPAAAADAAALRAAGGLPAWVPPDDPLGPARPSGFVLTLRLAAHGDADAARREAEAVEPAPLRAQARRVVAEALAAEGRVDAALQAAERVLFDPEAPLAEAAAAAALVWSLGEEPRAARWLEAALDRTDPGPGLLPSLLAAWRACATAIGLQRRVEAVAARAVRAAALPAQQADALLDWVAGVAPAPR
jgi:hypothetical protein